MFIKKVDSGIMIHQPILEKGIFRFDCSSEDRNAAFPSLSFADFKLRETPITSNLVPSYFPTFEKTSEQQFITLVLPEGTNFYGTGEASGPLERTGKRIDLRSESIIKFAAPISYPVITFGPFASPNDVLVSLSHAIDSAGRAIWMLDPGIKFEKGYFVYDSGSEIGVWVQSADGKPFTGDAWPGPCAFPDFTQSKVRSWWANLVKDFVSNGVDGIWNDMNEPAVFKVVTKTMPENNVHLGDPEIGGRQNHSHYHNVYGMLMARSTYEGMKLANANKRPFVLTRAGFIGSQRYAATWTGDNLSTWEHLHMSISMVLQLSLSGQPLSGPDIGGFAGNATPRLFARWMGIGSLFPFSRGHSDRDSIDHEPWSFGVEIQPIQVYVRLKIPSCWDHF